MGLENPMISRAGDIKGPVRGPYRVHWNHKTCGPLLPQSHEAPG